MLQTHVYRAEKFHPPGELSSDPASHEESGHDKGDYATELVGEYHEHRRDEEGRSRTQRFRESKGSTIGQESRRDKDDHHYCVDGSVEEHTLINVVLEPLEEWFNHPRYRLPIVHHQVCESCLIRMV